MAHIVRHGTADLTEDPRSAAQIVRAAAAKLPEDLTYAEAAEVLQAALVEVREAASLERFREEEAKAKDTSGSPASEVLERLAAQDEEEASPSTAPRA